MTRSATLLAARSLTARLIAAQTWLLRQPAQRPLWVICNDAQTARRLLHKVSIEKGATLGWRAATPLQLAQWLAAPSLLQKKRRLASSLERQAMAAAAAGRFQPQARLAALFTELTMSGCPGAHIAHHAPELAELYADYQARLAQAGRVDAREIFAAADAHLSGASTSAEKAGAILWLEPDANSPVEGRLLAGLANAASDVAATAALDGMDRIRQLKCNIDWKLADAQDTHPDTHPTVFFSAHDPYAECAEVVRRILRLAASDTPFARVAVGLPQWHSYAPIFAATAGKAGVPCAYARALQQPWPAGRALLALLRWRINAYARADFAEYLALAPYPDLDDTWENQLIASGLIQGRGAWQSITDERLRDFVLPLLGAADALQDEAWPTCQPKVEHLARLAIQDSDEVTAVLRALSHLGECGPSRLAHVYELLQPLLSRITVTPPAPREGHVVVAPSERLWPGDVDAGFVLGLADGVYPERTRSDGWLSDVQKSALSNDLMTASQRQDQQAQVLSRLIAEIPHMTLSYPRTGFTGQTHLPSTYLFDVWEEHRPSGTAADLVDYAASAGPPATSWPLPHSPDQALDASEYDLAVLEESFADRLERSHGKARYLLDVNAHVGRALRARARRWRKGAWTSNDGFVGPSTLAKAALAAHHPGNRAYSPTALQHYAACPYRFFLYAVQNLRAPDLPAAIWRMDALQRGSLIHEIQYETLTELKARQLLPLQEPQLAEAESLLHAIAERVGHKYRLEWQPRSDYLWQRELQHIESDLCYWLESLSRDRVWTPTHFELAFGLPGREHQDPASIPQPVQLDCGISLRGAIDLVETSASGALRASDYKTGKKNGEQNLVIGGGEILQPLLYALALEKIFPGKQVKQGRLYFCTSRGDFAECNVTLDASSRVAAEAIARALREAFAQGMFVAYPGRSRCQYCDYRQICGPYEEVRTAQLRSAVALPDLHRLRRMP